MPGAGPSVLARGVPPRSRRFFVVPARSFRLLVAGSCERRPRSLIEVVAGAGWTQGFANAETRLVTDNPGFNSADELSTFIELGIHNQFLHGASVSRRREVFGPLAGAAFSSPCADAYGSGGRVAQSLTVNEALTPLK